MHSHACLCMQVNTIPEQRRTSRDPPAVGASQAFSPYAQPAPGPPPAAPAPAPPAPPAAPTEPPPGTTILSADISKVTPHFGTYWAHDAAASSGVGLPWV